MTDIGKFLSNIQKIKKHDRQNNSGNPDYNRIFRELNSLFLRSTSCPADLARSVFEYWENEYIFNSQNQKEEPSEENSQRLARRGQNNNSYHARQRNSRSGKTCYKNTGRSNR